MATAMTAMTATTVGFDSGSSGGGGGVMVVSFLFFSSSLAIQTHNNKKKNIQITETTVNWIYYVIQSI